MTGTALLIFTCAACRAPADANAKLVMSIPAKWNGREYVADSNGNREPVCESCARQLHARFEHEHRPIPPVVQEPDYFERAYHQGAHERTCDRVFRAVLPNTSACNQSPVRGAEVREALGLAAGAALTPGSRRWRSHLRSGEAT